ncbi:ABC transporter ATP-binding protein [Caballeronia sp. 15711]|uniref:ABC transporter ATP-binding protein n=1 Tax=Caballeronia sp. 15711 TaxID=3391029 RepID=UPI0039E6CAF5
MNAPADSSKITEEAGVEPGEEIFARFDPRIFGRIAGFVRPYRWRCVAAFASVTVFTAAQLGIPYVVRYAIDSVVCRSSVGLAFALSVFGALVAAYAASQFLNEWLSARIAQCVIFDLRRAMFAHLQQVSLGLLGQTQSGRLMSRLQGDVNALQEFMENSVSSFGDLFHLAGIVVVLLAMDYRLGLFTLAVLPPLVVLRAIWIRRARAAFSRAREASSSVNAALAENINGIRTVQEHRREAVNLERYTERARENLEAQIASSRLGQMIVPAVDMLTGVALAIVVVAGGAAVVSGALDVGVMVAFIFYVQRFFDPIRTLSMQYTVMQRAVAAGYRIFEVLDLPVTISDAPQAVDIDGLPPSIELEHVSFGYRPGLAVLHDINLRIAPYQTVALVGPTGSGKTSIAALVHRFHDVWLGAVRVGGHDVRHVALTSLGRTVGIVLQEPFLFSGSILDNIRYGRGDATRQQVIAAAQAVRAHDFIIAFPEGYDTQLGQRGRNLSLGQRQLLSFARALLAEPAILILDEATANIDSFTEREIQQAMRVLMRGRTCLIIAHRLATIRQADTIVVMHDGRIAEQGTHAQLVERGGLYAQLEASSSASFDDLSEPGITPAMT